MAGAFSSPEQWRVAMLSMVDSGLLQPVREQMERMHRDLVKQRDTWLGRQSMLKVPGLEEIMQLKQID